ncbi:hypothetical protein AYK21_06135 [Thermoplasmatales archaeon SG8-52-2]|nr:MAG: hypothetical protein AYK21_06135 [Thermoplasmatales archaeon SG8-52-2]
MVGISFILIFSTLFHANANINIVLSSEEPPGIVWSKTYGGINADRAVSVQQTYDGGFIVAGPTNSYGAGGWDAWLIKTDSEGNEVWNKTYGGTLDDDVLCVIETRNGGYAIAGYSEYSQGKYELWILKTYNNGTEEWSKKYRKGDTVFGFCIIEIEHGYVVVSKAEDDVWLLGIDENGIIVWNNTFGGAKPDWGLEVIQDDYGDYVIVGYTFSFGHGDADIWLIKANETGEELWNKTFGGGGYDTAGDVIQTYDGGYAITGGITTSNGWRHFCLIKTDENGSELWTKIYIINDFEVGSSLIQTVEGDYLIVGSTDSFGSKGCNACVIKTDENGVEVWNVTYGGNGQNSAGSIIGLNDKEFVTAGTYENDESGDDFWLVKLGYIPIVTIEKPKKGLYFMDFLIRPFLFRNPLIIGSINVEVDAVDNKYEVEKVEFYVNDYLMGTDFSEPYSYTWNDTSFGRYKLKAVAFNSNNYFGFDEIWVWKFF